MEKDTIVDIPENRVKFFGTSGKMLLPSADTIKLALKKIPKGKLITTTTLRQYLTEQFQVQGTCPVTTKKALTLIAKDSDSNVPYWRVVNQNGNIVSGLGDNMTLLEAEGLNINEKGKTRSIQDYKSHLFELN